MFIYVFTLPLRSVFCCKIFFLLVNVLLFFFARRHFPLPSKSLLILSVVVDGKKELFEMIDDLMSESSLATLLQFRQPNPGAILLALGFGGSTSSPPLAKQFNQPLMQIPSRFFEAQSFAKGISTTELCRIRNESDCLEFCNRNSTILNCRFVEIIFVWILYQFYSLSLFRSNSVPKNFKTTRSRGWELEINLKFRSKLPSHCHSQCARMCSKLFLELYQCIRLGCRIRMRRTGKGVPLYSFSFTTLWITTHCEAHCGQGWLGYFLPLGNTWSPPKVLTFCCCFSLITNRPLRETDTTYNQIMASKTKHRTKKIFCNNNSGERKIKKTILSRLFQRWRWLREAHFLTGISVVPLPHFGFEIFPSPYYFFFPGSINQ